MEPARRQKTQRQSRALPLGVINEEQEDETEADKGLEAPDDYSEGLVQVFF